MKLSMRHGSDGDAASRLADGSLCLADGSLCLADGSSCLAVPVALADLGCRLYPGYHGCAVVGNSTERYHSKTAMWAGNRGDEVEQGMHREASVAACVRVHAGCPRSDCLTI
jgi:hypothetical protein